MNLTWILKRNNSNLHFLCSNNGGVWVQYGLHLCLCFATDVNEVIWVHPPNNSLVGLINLKVLRHLGTIKSEANGNNRVFVWQFIVSIFDNGLDVTLQSFTNETHVTLTDGSIP